ncbi:hypothetical protein [Actinomyces trachealis]|uniref:hypothetical protein n=1 Tax=Actinomyces trachealis TaxID=2763540 RepID=UPI0018C5D33F|nr:hypothetical protein [Actinomyces trachealis]
MFIQLYGTCLPGKDAPATQEPALAVPRTVTLTRTQVTRLLAKGSGITRQPPSARARLDMPVIAYTNPATQTLTTTWKATFTTPGQDPKPVQGTITTTPFETHAYTAVLTNQAKTTNPNQPPNAHTADISTT